MSIATALTALADDVSAAKAAIEAKGGTAPNGTADMADAIAAIPSGGITPSGKKLITDTSETDVAAFATAQVSSDTLLAENIKKDVNILGVVGSFEGGGRSVLDDILGAPTLLYTATVTEPVHGINIPVGDGWKTDYDYLLFAFDLEFSASDWLYFCKDTYISTAPYVPQSNSFKGANAWMMFNNSTNFIPRTGTKTLSGAPTTQWVFQLYTASVNITNGTIKVYGGVYS